jgi:uncharacterized membrane protein (DUF106 family)
MKHASLVGSLLVLSLAGCANQGMMGQPGGMNQAQHMEHMKTMQSQMARIKQTSDPAERQKLMEEHMKLMDDHMGRMQTMPCGKM